MVASLLGTLTRDGEPDLCADGMAFFLARHPSGVPPGSFGRNLGLFNDTTKRNATSDDRVVAVEFDTYRNPEWEKNGNHVGIDVNSIVSVASVSPDKTFKSGETLAAEVAYDNSTETLSVTLWMDGTSYRVNASVDMRRSLPEMVAVGFSAATGGNIEVHRLLSWSFNYTLASPKDEAITSPGMAAPVPPEAISSKNQAKSHGAIAVSAATVFVVVCALMGFLLRRKLRTWKKPKVVDGGELEEEEQRDDDDLEKGVGPKRYHYSELAAATGNFSEEKKLGRGGFGHVYQGCLKIDGQDRHVAIKKFTESSVQGRKEFEAEVKIISRLRHRNLV
ncbi:L-type lectin-domain containing receptor kinase IX.1-like [Panicum miliaceum]|uniref:non-specific serine/threonine protein kinase n=1 Tax=Panicum miliaceum TaxID=4540 RepID=A0A3L6QQW2_PANMI|nr:L-type lectin-domain containing receptor kinase IX.1-like [Panicum miliaceum]